MGVVDAFVREPPAVAFLAVVDRDSWTDVVQSRQDPTNALMLIAPLGPSEGGSSGSFPVRASDGNRWYLKPLNNFQSPRVVINEFLLGRAGRLIGAPVCEVAVMAITPDHVGYEFRPGGGRLLEEGYGCASRAVPGVREERAFEYRNRDDNARRHVGVFAMYDWCYGSDPQWLYQGSADEALFSHDHGHYLPNGPEWDAAGLEARVDEAHPIGGDTANLDRATVDDIADKLERVGHAELVPILQEVPASWPVTNEELEAVGYFLHRRAAPAAERLRSA